MTEQKWEYCELRLINSKQHYKEGTLFKAPEHFGWSYDCSIRYYGPDGNIVFRRLAELENILSINPFFKATGLLGGSGWEMVSMQHGNVYGGGGSVQWDKGNYALVLDNKVAFFKRSVTPGRGVAEPQLEI